jgi:preprotein translocase subunit SecE
LLLFVVHSKPQDEEEMPSIPLTNKSETTKTIVEDIMAESIVETAKITNNNYPSRKQMFLYFGFALNLVIFLTLTLVCLKTSFHFIG